MSGIVVDLQREALLKEVSISDLLRKAYFISKKLGIEEGCSWIKNELDGYAASVDIPKYRQIKGQLFLNTPNNGLQNLHVKDFNFLKSISTRAISASVASIEAEIRSDGNIYYPFPNDIKNKFMDHYQGEYIPLWGCSNTGFISILDSLRNRILD
ncbi:AbiTii domain-containing protein, partial [Vibrio alginolyticus]